MMPICSSLILWIFMHGIAADQQIQNDGPAFSYYMPQTEPEPSIPRQQDGSYAFESVVMPSFPDNFFPGIPNENAFNGMDALVKNLGPNSDTVRPTLLPEPDTHHREKRNMMGGDQDIQARMGMFQNPSIGMQGFAGQSGGQFGAGSGVQGSGSGVSVGGGAAAGSSGMDGRNGAMGFGVGQAGSGGGQANSGGFQMGSGGGQTGSGGFQMGSGGQTGSGGFQAGSGGGQSNSGGLQMGSGGGQPSSGGVQTGSGGGQSSSGGFQMGSGGGLMHSAGSQMSSGGAQISSGGGQASFESGQMGAGSGQMNSGSGSLPVVVYYNGGLVQPGQNPYGFPNSGTQTYPGAVSTTTGPKGYPVTISSYTKVIDGKPTYGAVTVGMPESVYNGNTLNYGQNLYGYPSTGTYTIPGTTTVQMSNGIPVTLSYLTRIQDGTTIYGTATYSPVEMRYVTGGGGGSQINGNMGQYQNMGGSGMGSQYQNSNSGQYQVMGGNQGGNMGVNMGASMGNSMGSNQGSNMGMSGQTQNFNSGGSGQSQNFNMGGSGQYQSTDQNQNFNMGSSQNVNSGSGGQFQGSSMGNDGIPQNQNVNQGGGGMSGQYQNMNTGGGGISGQYQNVNTGGNSGGNIIQPTRVVVPSTFQPFPGPANIPSQGTYWYGLTTFYSSINNNPVTVTSFINYNNGASTYGAITYGSNMQPITFYAQGSVYNVNGGLVVCAECVSKGSENSIKVVVTSDYPQPNKMNPISNYVGFFGGQVPISLTPTGTKIIETFPTVMFGFSVTGTRTRYDNYFVGPNGQRVDMSAVNAFNGGNLGSLGSVPNNAGNQGNIPNNVNTFGNNPNNMGNFGSGGNNPNSGGNGGNFGNGGNIPNNADNGGNFGNGGNIPNSGGNGGNFGNVSPGDGSNNPSPNSINPGSGQNIFTMNLIGGGQVALTKTTAYEQFQSVINGQLQNGLRTRGFYVLPNGQEAMFNSAGMLMNPPNSIQTNPSPNSIDLSGNQNMGIFPSSVQSANQNANIANAVLIPQGYTISPYTFLGSDKYLTYGAMSYGYPDGSNAQPTAIFDFQIIQPGNAIVGAGSMTSSTGFVTFQTNYQGQAVTGTRTVAYFNYAQGQGQRRDDGLGQQQGGQNVQQQFGSGSNQGQQSGSNQNQAFGSGSVQGQNQQFGSASNQGQRSGSNQNQQFGGASDQVQQSGNSQSQQGGMFGGVQNPQFGTSGSNPNTGSSLGNAQGNAGNSGAFGGSQSSQMGISGNQQFSGGQNMNQHQFQGSQMQSSQNQNSQGSQQQLASMQGMNHGSSQSTIQPSPVQPDTAQNPSAQSQSVYSIQGTDGLVTFGAMTFMGQSGRFYTATDIRTISPITAVPGMTLTSTTRLGAGGAFPTGGGRVPMERTMYFFFYAPSQGNQVNEMPKAMALSGGTPPLPGVGKLSISVQKPVVKRSADGSNGGGVNSANPRSSSRQAFLLSVLRNKNATELLVKSVLVCGGNSTGLCPTTAEVCQWNGHAHACRCLPGYTQSETPNARCEDINECSDPALNGCSADAMCINLVGNFLCFCREGFVDVSPDGVGSGRVCLPQALDLSIDNATDVVMFDGVVQRADNPNCVGYYWYIGDRCQIHWLGLAVGLAIFVLLIILGTTCLCYHCNRRQKMRAVDMSFYAGQKPVQIHPVYHINGKPRKVSKRVSTQSQNWDFPRRLMDQPEDKPEVRGSTLTLSPSFISRSSADSLDDRLSCGSGDQLIRTGHVRDRKRHSQVVNVDTQSITSVDVASLYPEWPKPDRRSNPKK